MSPPRIHFAGRFYTNTNTINNERLNFLLSTINSSNVIVSWNPHGTNEWAFIDCYVTSAVDENESGEVVTITSADIDPVVGLPLINNPDTSLPKLVDLDPDHQTVPTIWGMALGVNWDPTSSSQENAFIADFVPSVIASDLWLRQIPFSDPAQQPIGSRSSSRLENVTWSSSISSTVLKKMKDLSQGGSLSISLSLYNYTRSSKEDLWMYGSVVGSIGVVVGNESLSFPEDRVMTFTEDPPIDIPEHKPCHDAEHGQWMMTAYFDVRETVLAVNFGNTFKIDQNGSLCDLFPFYLGVLTRNDGISTSDAVEIISAIDQTAPAWYTTTAGIQEFRLTNHQKEMVDNSSVVVVMLQSPPDNGNSDVKQLYPICDTSTTSAHAEMCVHIILKENPCFVSPMDYFVFRLENADTTVLQMKYREYGQVVANATVALISNGPNDKPTDTDLQYNRTMTTDSNGIATFHFVAGDIGEPRENLKIDGQVFTFEYCAETCSIDKRYKCEDTNIGNVVSLLIWSSIDYEKPYFWDTHVQPILSQYEQMYPAMGDILKLGDYDDVTKPHNIHLLNISLSLDISHPSHMPVTRDLSPTKRDMILEWLNTDDHPRSWEDMEQRLYDIHPYCNHTILVYHNKTATHEVPMVVIQPSFGDNEDSEFDDMPRPRSRKRTLSTFHIAHKYHNISIRTPNTPIPHWAGDTHTCTPETLLKDLQTAISLEFSTIPPYLTALYSIKDGHNKEVYSIIRSVAMQEMLHLAQAANILIAIGGHPLIDSPKAVPTSFPTHLHGSVLPGLEVTLKKASPKHIAHVFMMIEFPDRVMNESAFHEVMIKMDALTIGNFYSSLRKCMNKLYKAKKITFGNVEKQLYWPWPIYDKTSQLYKVNNIKDANASIEMIIEQGEGTETMDPTYLGTEELAHFFKFGELACKRHIQVIQEHVYDFHGSEIEFTSEGVWPMRDNPSQKGLIKGSQAYRATKIFHRIYRSLLKSLQVAFDGNPDMIKEVVYIMESLQIQAKKLMKMECPTPDGHPKRTCGPIFDYEWNNEL